MGALQTNNAATHDLTTDAGITAYFAHERADAIGRIKPPKPLSKAVAKQRAREVEKARIAEYVSDLIDEITKLDYVVHVPIWDDRRAYIELHTRNKRFRGDRNHQLYITLSTGNLISGFPGGIISDEYYGSISLVTETVDAFKAQYDTKRAEIRSYLEGVVGEVIN